MEKRYQVFVSSTYKDLIDERRAVMQALLELDCIPAGMELFPASDDDSWTLIKRVIDDCDYYLVILAGRYGSMDRSGVSYTEKEYDYAFATGKPVISFLHGDPGAIPARNTDSDPEVRSKLEAFRAKIQEDKQCRFWQSPEQLGTAVTTSYAKLIKTHPAEGWVKARYMKTTEDAEKLANALEQASILKNELDALRKLGVADTHGLAQGEDAVRLEFETRTNTVDIVETTWNEIFAVVGRACLELPDDGMIGWTLKNRWDKSGAATNTCVQMLKVQFFSLGLIRFATIVRGRPQDPRVVSAFGSVDYLEKYWELTDYGRVKLAELIAVKHATV